ncbi:MAG: hypothetical protein KDD22_00235, partial [Bdellovibrionales bacterium]|nr:hypothetical protein [Bdellovibrionales bacterium]
MTMVKFRSFGFFGIGLLGLLFHLSAFAIIEENPVLDKNDVGSKEGLFVEYFNYRDYIYSNSKKTETGDNIRTDVGVRYQFSESTFGRLRFKTDPVENRESSKTSEFEILAGHSTGNWKFQGDVEVKMNDGNDTSGDSAGEISVGLDLDSELTFIEYDVKPVDIKFYPYNFNGRVGRQFKTWDVTRLYFVEGAPNTFSTSPTGGEKIAQKTIPGFELGYSFSSDHLNRAYMGIGLASYLYPSNENFNIFDQAGPQSDRWSRNETYGYKLGYNYHGEDLQIDSGYVAFNKSAETGSLLQAAGPIYALGRLSTVIIEGEICYTRGGDRPYRLNDSETWFSKTAPWAPIYSNTSGTQLQDWIGKSAFAYSLRLGLEYESFTPYLSYKHLGSRFVYRERDSAEKLRTADESQSHGG